MSAENPISPKAIAATTGSGIGAATAALLTWVLGVTVWDGSATAANVSAAIAAVPGPVSAAIGLVIPAGLAGILGWQVSDPNRVTTPELQTLRRLQDEGGQLLDNALDQVKDVFRSDGRE